MNIDRDAAIAGIPSFVLRAALRQRVGAEWSGEALARELDADSSRLLPALHEGGWIEPRSRPDMWINTMQGNALAQAKARRVSRATAQRHLDALLDRARALKSDPRQLYRVERIALFGSFADADRADVGDVDVVIELTTKEPNWERHLTLEEAYRDREERDGRTFRSFIDRLLAPRQDPYRLLKGRSAFRTIFDEPADEPERADPAGDERGVSNEG